MKTRTGLRDLRKEKIWRERIERWRSSKLGQADFCRKEGINPNTFSSWKTIIGRRDAEAKSKKAQAGSIAADKPGFVRLALEEEDTLEASESTSLQSSRREHLGLAGELVDGGRTLRLFNGADASIVASLLAAFSGSQIG